MNRHECEDDEDEDDTSRSLRGRDIDSTVRRWIVLTSAENPTGFRL